MWVRKDKQYGPRGFARPWLSFRGPAIWFVLMFFGAIALAYQGPRVARSHWPDSWQDALRPAATFAAVIALAVYVLQIILKTRLAPFADRKDTVICDCCHRVKHRDRQDRCECGGKFDDFDNWTWIDDSEVKTDNEVES